MTSTYMKRLDVGDLNKPQIASGYLVKFMEDDNIGDLQNRVNALLIILPSAIEPNLAHLVDISYDTVTIQDEEDSSTTFFVYLTFFIVGVDNINSVQAQIDAL